MEHLNMEYDMTIEYATPELEEMSNDNYEEIELTVPTECAKVSRRLPF